MTANHGGPEVPVAGADSLVVAFGGVQALSGVDLVVPAGEIRGLIGPNGAGKTTLFDCITGVRFPSQGRIQLSGQDVTNRSAVWRSRNGVRRTFQRQQPFAWLSVEDNILAALDWHGGGGGIVADLLALPGRRRREAARRELVDEAIERCGLEDVRRESAAKLSIGRARMVELARAIVDRPTLLLLDEPTSGLEEAEAQKLAEVVRELRSTDGRSVLLVEHDVGFVMDLCDRVTVLQLGRVIGEGTPAEIMADAAVREAYLGDAI